MPTKKWMEPKMTSVNAGSKSQTHPAYPTKND